MKKAQAKYIKDVAAQMGTKQYVTKEWVSVSGEDLLLSGHKTFKGEPIDKNASYEMLFPVFHTDTFEKDLKKAFLKNGDKGLYEIVSTEYIARVRKGLIKHEK
jgi:hypothetical protein